MKLRLTYSKTGLVRFISHRDLMMIFFRSFRRAGLPVSFSRGFNPHPRVEFCPPLPVGMEGMKEIVEVRLSRPVKAERAITSLNEVLPEGIRITSARLLDDKNPTLGKTIEGAEYSVHLRADTGLTRGKVEQFLSSSEVWLERKKEKSVKRVDVRRGVSALEYREAESGAGEHIITVSLKSNSRPDEVLAAMIGRKPEELKGLRWRRLRFCGRDL